MFAKAIGGDTVKACIDLRHHILPHRQQYRQNKAMASSKCWPMQSTTTDPGKIRAAMLSHN